MDPIGKTQQTTGFLDPARAAAMQAALGIPGPAPVPGDTLPPFWHWAYFWDAQPAAALGRDGHPRLGDFIPDLGFPRRMWAGGTLDFLAPLQLGQSATRETRITDIRRKIGRSGPFAVVELCHILSQGGAPCLQETQTVLYRAADAPPGQAPQAPIDETVSQGARFTPVDLFRYSALTFNGHRIHYDRDYATGVEGYPGLVVHGPLLAQRLIHLAEGMLGRLTRFEFRATAPLFDGEDVAFCARQDADGLALWARAGDGRQCVTARASAR